MIKRYLKCTENEKWKMKTLKMNNEKHWKMKNTDKVWKTLNMKNDQTTGSSQPSYKLTNWIVTEHRNVNDKRVKTKRVKWNTYRPLMLKKTNMIKCNYTGKRLQGVWSKGCLHHAFPWAYFQSKTQCVVHFDCSPKSSKPRNHLRDTL